MCRSAVVDGNITPPKYLVWVISCENTLKLNCCLFEVPRAVGYNSKAGLFVPSSWVFMQLLLFFVAFKECIVFFFTFVEKLFCCVNKLFTNSGVIKLT